MARSAHHQKLVLLLLCGALMVATAAVGKVVTYSVPAFDATTTGDMVAATNTTILTSASDLFVAPEFNASEGFLLLSDAIDLWRGSGGANGGGAPGNVDEEEASFNSSFTVLAGAAPVSFVVLTDAFPPLFGRGGLRGFGNYSMSAGGPVPTNATAAGALVEVDAVQSYGPDDPTPGLNVTVTPRGGGCAVWVEYDAGAHRLSVFVAGAGAPRPANALVSMPLGADGWRWTTETALVGFFAGAIRDVIVGVRDWELTVDGFPGDGKKGASWWVILLAVLGSVVAAAAVVAAAVCYVQKRRRRGQLNVDHRPKM